MPAIKELGYGPWAYKSKSDARLIGYGGLEVLPGHPNVEASYIFARDVWEQGFASEVAQAMIEHGFNQLGLPEIGASVDPRNVASIKVIEKLGMKHVYDGLDEYGLLTRFYALRRPENDE